MDVKRALNDVGSAVFVKYYYEFKNKSHAECVELFDEPFTYKSKSSRTTKAQKLFAEKQNRDALERIIHSDRIEPAVIQRAKTILAAENN